jgi:hypothetical protein
MSSRYHTLTIIAIAVIVYALSSVLHEGVGHGGACLLSGCHAREMSTVHFDGNGPHPKVVDAGGTIVNLLVGAICWLALRAASAPRKSNVHVHYFLWLLMSVNLFQGGGYFLFSGVGNIGDWADVIAGLRPSLAWHAALTIVGIVTYCMFVWVSLTGLLPFLPAANDERWRAAKKLMLVPYLAGGLLSCFAGMFNPVGMMLVAISAAAASFGGTSGFAWSWQLLRGTHFMSDPAVPQTVMLIPRSIPWIVAAAIVGIAFVAVLGPGIRFS